MVAPAVADAVGALDLADEDVAVVRLAREYAAAIDAAQGDVAVLSDLGPKLLAVLKSLGATPKDRAGLGGGGAARGPSRLDHFRENAAG